MATETMASSTAWPSLNESHGATDVTTTPSNGNGWEMIADEIVYLK